MAESYRKSASQIKLYIACPTKWGHKYLGGFVEEKTVATELGSAVHKVQENWLRDRIPPDLSTVPGKIAFAGLQHLPSPSPLLEVEREVIFSSDRHKYIVIPDLGFLDVYNIPHIFDHKTTVDFKWALTEGELAVDIQANLYAKEALDRYGAPFIEQHWVYYKTKGAPASHVVNTRRHKDSVEEEFAKIELIADQIDQARQLPIIELPKNLSMCQAYHRPCPHIARCHLGGTERMVSIMSQSLIEQLRQRNASGANGQAAPPMPQQPQAPQMAPPQAPPQPTYTPVPQAGPASQVAGNAGYAPQAPPQQQYSQPAYVPQQPQPPQQPAYAAPQQPAYAAPQQPAYTPAPPQQPAYTSQPYVPMNPPEQNVQLPPQVEEEKPRRQYTKREKEVTSTNVFHLVLQCAALIGGRTPEDARRALDAVLSGPK